MGDDREWDGEDRRHARMPIGSTMERHAQTIIGALILSMLIGVGTILLDLRDRVSRGEVQVSGLLTATTILQNQIQANYADRYSAADARRDFEGVYRRVNENAERINSMEREWQSGSSKRR